MLNEKCITITGFKFYYGSKPFSIGTLVKFQKDKTNSYDSDAIRAILPFFDTVGYIANTPYTKANGTNSASRIYDKVGDTFYGKVLFKTNNMIICKIVKVKKKVKRSFSNNLGLYTPPVKVTHKNIFSKEELWV